jgi:hypothetical protein
MRELIALISARVPNNNLHNASQLLDDDKLNNALWNADWDVSHPRAERAKGASVDAASTTALLAKQQKVSAAPLTDAASTTALLAKQQKTLPLP